MFQNNSSEVSLILLSGPVAGGKSAVATALLDGHGFRRISTGGHLVTVAEERGIPVGRTELQNLGDALDIETDFLWPVDVTIRQMQSASESKLWLLDAVRKERQVHHFRKAFQGVVLHVHLTASEEIIRARYEQRIASGHAYGVDTSYEEMLLHPNEVASRDLQKIADLCIDTGSSPPNSIAISVVDYLKGGKYATSCPH